MRALGWLILAAIVIGVVVGQVIVTFDPSIIFNDLNRSNVTAPSCQQQPISTNDGIHIEATAPQSNGLREYIGISDGRFAFDLPGPDGIYKCQAALSLLSKKSNDAKGSWAKALRHLSNDAEVLIYQEDQRILDQHLPSISFIVGATLTGNAVSLGRDILQGAYTAQKSYNDARPTSTQIRLLIANFGSQASYSSEIAQWIMQAAASEQQHVEGIMGLPPAVLSSDSSNSPEMITRLSGPFPVVLPSGSNGRQEESPTAANFFHVAPSVQWEGEVGADYVMQNCPYVLSGSTQVSFDCPGNRILLLYDDANTYSQRLADAFAQRLSADEAKGGVSKTVSLTRKPYITGDTQKIDQIVASLKEAQSPPDLIYFAGNAADANTLLGELPSSGAFINLRVLGADALYELGGYKEGLFRRLDFSAFAYPDEWGWLGLSQPTFFDNYRTDFSGGLIGYGYDRPDNDVILAYDALSLLLRGSEIASKHWTKQFTPDKLLAVLRSTVASQGFQGISGLISFGPDGNPVDKALVMLRVDPTGHIELQGIQGRFR